MNGGFTVFGTVIGDGMEVVDAIAALQVLNASGTANGTFSQLPVRDYTGGVVTAANLVFISMPRVGVMSSQLEFGMVYRNESAIHDVRVINQSASDLTLGTIGNVDPIAAPFGIVTDDCPPVLSANASCVVQVSFSPSQLGDFTDSFDIPSDDIDTPSVTVQLSGVGSLPIQLSPAAGLTLGGVDLGGSATRSVTLSNGPNVAVTVTGVSITGVDADEFSQTSGCSVIAQGGSCQVAVTFSPVAIGSKSVVLSIDTDNAEQPLIEIPISANVQVPNIGVLNRSIDTGDVLLNDTNDETLTLINGGDADLSVISMNITGPDADQFSVTRNCTSMTPSQQCSETITYAPTSLGPVSATLTIASNDPDTPTAEVTVTGFGRDSKNRLSLDNDEGPVTLLSPVGTELFDAAAIDNPSVDDLPAGISFAQGFYEFTIRLQSAGASAALAISFPRGAVPTTYYKYGPTADDATPHWYEFMWDGRTGAVIQENVITLYFVDGERGDSDLAVNGLIEDPGAPGVGAASSGGGSSSPTPSSSGGGGCSVVGHAVSPRNALADWALLLLFIVALPMRGRMSGNAAIRPGSKSSC